MEDESFSIEALIFIVILVIYILASYYINKLQIGFLHQSTVAIVLGFLTALFLKFIMEKEIMFSSQLFFSLIMPPIVFSVGYDLKKPEFFKNFLSIGFLGIFATLFSIMVQASVINLLSGNLIISLTSKQITLLSIILSSSDPIATLPVLKSNTNHLNAILSGQGVLNCSVIIILFGTVQRLSQNYQNILEFEAILAVLTDFTYLFICSILLGMLFGFGLSYLFKKIVSFSDYHIKQTSLILLTGYVVYLSGQFAGLSGIIALFTTAIVFSQYGFKNLSDQSQHGTLLAFQSIRYIFQAFIFTYLGASLLATENKWNALGAAIMLISFNPIIRLLMIYLLSLILKLLKRPFPLSKAETKLLWYTGIVRGIIAFALSLQIKSTNQAYILTATLLVVMCTTIIGATFFNRFCQIIGLGQVGLIKIGNNRDDQRQIELVPSTKYGAIGSPYVKNVVLVTENDEKFKNFEEKYLKPFFTRNNVQMVTKKQSKQHTLSENL